MISSLLRYNSPNGLKTRTGSGKIALGIIGVSPKVRMAQNNTKRVLGQLLFYPPNVAGWPGGKNWIDSSSLMMRMRIPKLINDLDEMNVKAKDDDDTMMGMKDGNMQAKGNKKPGGQQSGAAYAGMRRQQINANVDWQRYVKHYESVPRENLAETISKILLQTKSRVSMDIIKQYADQTGRENFIKTASMQVMSTPEYQLC